MNCPHCQKELPENYDAVACPFCGRDLRGTTPEIKDSPATSLEPIKIKWLIFFAVLLAPPVLTLFSASLVHVQNESYSVAIGLLGGGAAGIACGVMLGLRLGKTRRQRIGLCLFFAALMVVVCILLCWFGCGLGGYQMRFG